MISPRTASPSRSMDVTSISSTMHLRVPTRWSASLQVDLSSAAHWPTSCPCNDHLCSSGKSVRVIFSTTLPLPLVGNRQHSDAAPSTPSRYLPRLEYGDHLGKQFCGDGIETPSQSGGPVSQRLATYRSADVNGCGSRNAKGAASTFNEAHLLV